MVDLSKRLSGVWVLLMLATSVGCTLVSPFAQKDIPTDINRNPGNQYQVVMMQPVGPPKTFNGEVTDKTTVQSALEESGALKKYRKMTVDVYRVMPESGKTLKMACEFQTGKRILKYEQDYQLFPSDRIIVTVEPNVLEKMMGSGGQDE